MIVTRIITVVKITSFFIIPKIPIVAEGIYVSALSRDKISFFL